MKIRRKDSDSSVAGGDILVAPTEGHHDGELPSDEVGTDEESPVSVVPAAAPTTAAATTPSAAPRPRGMLGEVLVARGVVSESQVAAALELQRSSGKRLGEVLVDMGALDERSLVEALADFFGMPVTDLAATSPDPAALALIPESLAREHLVIPVFVDGEGLHVAVSQPSDDLRFMLAETSGRSIRLRLAPISDIRWAVDRSYQALGKVEKAVMAFEAVEVTRKRTVVAEKTASVVDENAPVVQVVDSILTQALRDRASDVHIEPSDGVTYVRYRIDGVLKDVLELPVTMGTGLLSRIKIMADINIVEKRRSQDGQFSIDIDGNPADVRVATVATIWGEKCTLRILDKRRSVLRLDELGMPADTYETYSRLVRAPFGMVLCAGPTGSGKTTTLYATLSEASDRSRNVMTIEDPVEFVFPKINQIQTNEAAGMTFADGLKSILRQDPDVILVGEIRDAETARIAVQSALTGHFVLSSVHGNDSVSALHRFLDMGIESFLISSSVVGIVGQRLVRRICPSCRVRYTPSQDELAFYEESGGDTKTEFWHGSGCNYCSETGFLDRVGVYELLVMTSDIRRLVAARATQEDIRSRAQEQGMRTLRDEAVRLVTQDITTISEVMRSVYSA